MKPKRITILLSLTIVSVALLLPSASAHVPAFEGGGDSPETASHIHDPLKSWVIYDELHEGAEAHYFSLDMKEGERLRLQLFTPEENFVPSLVVIGPGVEANGTVPSYVEIPDGLQALVLEGERKDRAEYEPFTPASYYYTVDFDWEVASSGEYYLAVHEPSRGGRFGIAVGYIEEFSLQEWLTVPLDAIRIHDWEGQHIAVVLAPMIVTLVVGSFLLVWPPGRGVLNAKTQIWRFFGSVAGLLYIGSGFMMLAQMIIALSKSGVEAFAIVTLIFVAIPLVLGFLLIRMVVKTKSGLTRLGRISLLVLGILGLSLWAGLLIGPILSLVAGILPARFSPSSKDRAVDTEGGKGIHAKTE